MTRKRKLFEKYHFFVFDIRKLLLCILSWYSFESPLTKELHKGKRLPSLITDGIDRLSCLVHGSEWKQACLRVLEFINTTYSQHVYWSDIDIARIVTDQYSKQNLLTIFTHLWTDDVTKRRREKIVRSRHAEEKVSLGAVFGAGLGGATNYVCVSEPRGQGKLTPPPHPPV